MLWVCGSLYDESSAETNDFNKQVKSWMLYLKINSTDNMLFTCMKLKHQIQDVVMAKTHCFVDAIMDMMEVTKC